MSLQQAQLEEGLPPDTGPPRPHQEDRHHHTLRIVRVCQAAIWPEERWNDFPALHGQGVSGLPFILVYLDDILVASPDRLTHADHLHCVLQRFQEHGLFLNRAKCEFFRSEVEFLGLKVTAGGVLPYLSSCQQLKIFHHLAL